MIQAAIDAIRRPTSALSQRWRVSGPPACRSTRCGATSPCPGRDGPPRLSSGRFWRSSRKYCRTVVDQDFVLRVSEQLDPAAAAPLLCAGITTYSPLRHWRVGPGQRVGIVGLGGLGHEGLKFAKAFGAEVALFTTSPGKTADARRLGADEVIISRNADESHGRRTASISSSIRWQSRMIWAPTCGCSSGTVHSAWWECPTILIPPQTYSR